MLQPQQINIDVQVVINTLTNQRNAAMDEIVKMSGIIDALQKQVDQLTKPKEVANEQPDQA